MQSNGVVEGANTLIFEATKKILGGGKKGKCAEVMLKVIRSHSTSVARATNFSPFQLLFGAEAATTEEIKHKSSRAMPGAKSCPIEVEDKDLL
jgi:hypothetical protein